MKIVIIQHAPKMYVHSRLFKWSFSKYMLLRAHPKIWRVSPCIMRRRTFNYMDVPAIFLGRLPRFISAHRSLSVVYSWSSRLISSPNLSAVADYFVGKYKFRVWMFGIRLTLRMQWAEWHLRRGSTRSWMWVRHTSTMAPVIHPILRTTGNQ